MSVDINFIYCDNYKNFKIRCDELDLDFRKQLYIEELSQVVGIRELPDTIFIKWDSPHWQIEDYIVTVLNSKR